MAINKDLEAQFLGFIGVDKIETQEDFDKFKESFNQKFIPAETAHEYENVSKKVLGKRMTEITSKLNDFGKAIGLDVSISKLSEKKIEENLEDFSTAISTRLTELQTKAKDGNDKKVNDLTAQLEDMQKSIASYKEANEALRGEYDEYRSNRDNEIKSYKINHQLDQIKGGISWIDGINDIQRAGFNTVLSSQYHFDLDENDNLTVKDKEGKLIPLKDKAGEFASPAHIVSQVAEMGGLVKKNNLDKSKKVISFTENPKRETSTEGKLSSVVERRKAQLGL